MFNFAHLQIIDKLPVLPLLFELVGILVAWVSFCHT
jgi:hypothetical protein